jgi:hypothetical protein
VADLSLVFEEASILFSKVIVLAYIPTSSVRGFLFHTSSPTFFVVGFLDGSYSNKSEVEFWCGFDLHFLYGQGW